MKMSLEFVSLVPINNNPALVQLIAWYWLRDKPLPKPIMAYITNAYLHLSVSVS